MKQVLLLALLTVAALTTRAAEVTTDAYTVNDAQIEQLIAGSEDVSLTVVGTDLFADQQAAAGLTNPTRIKASKDFTTALLLNFFLGGFGIHRLYLGTETFTWIGYILTCGGIFGIVPLVDFVVLIINKDNMGQYEDNPKFFMWSNN
jgi:TM2 domain-containing membrane protein YozV